MAPAFEVADVLNAHWLKVLHSGQYHTWQVRTLDAVRRCRPHRLAVILMAVPVVAIYVSVIIAAVTGIVLNARVTNVKNGYRQDKQNYCPFPIFMWYLHCPIH